jgi:3'-phosphoadenosine 5'-phosphosulfate sulfotransferase (PAPS reductase)/FAD synthetase
MKQLTFDEAWAPPRRVDVASYDIVLLNTSGGKDSQTMPVQMLNNAKAAGVADRLIAVHCDLGRVEWPGTKELAQRQADLLGIPFFVVRRTGGDLLDYVEHRGQWPSSMARYCTSDFKRGPVRKLMTQLVATRWAKGEPPVRILNCLGLRADESPARAMSARATANVM